MTPLHYACIYSNSIEIVTTLLSIPSIDVNVHDEYGKTPRDYCRERHWDEAYHCIIDRQLGIIFNDLSM